MKKYILLFLMLFWVTICPAAENAVNTGIDLNAAEVKIQQLMLKAKTPGLSIAFIQRGEIVWRESFGMKNVKTPEPVTAETVFEAASLSKPVFAYAVLKYASAGNFDLNKPLTQYWMYEDFADSKKAGKITAKTVLTHTTGLPNWRSGNKLKFIGEPGKGFFYSGEAFVYLQKVIEHITGKPMEEFIREQVLDPLDMKDSSFVWQEKYESQAAAGHDQNQRIKIKSKPLHGNAAWSLHTTASDYARFMIALMNRTGLSAGLAEGIFTVELATRKYVNKNDYCGWGLGLGLQYTQDKGLSFWQWGDNRFFQAFMIGFPEQKTGLVYLTNSENGLRIRDELISFLLGSKHPAFKYIYYKQI